MAIMGVDYVRLEASMQRNGPDAVLEWCHTTAAGSPMDVKTRKERCDAAR